jgi:hypothetical protein
VKEGFFARNGPYQPFTVLFTQFYPMVNKILFLSLASSFVLDLHAPSAKHSVEDYPLVAYVYKGDVFDYQVSKSRATYQRTALLDSCSMDGLLSLSVLDSTELGYVFEANYENDLNLVPLALQDQDLAKLSKKQIPLKVQYQTDPRGAFQSWKNLDNWQAHYRDFFQKMGPKLRNVAQSERINGLRERLCSSTYLAEHGWEELLMLHSFYGKSLKLDTILSYDLEWPNPDDPQHPLQALATVQLTTDVEDSNIGILRYKAKIKSVQNLPESLRKQDFPLEDSNILKIDLNYGVVLNLQHERMLAIPNGHAVETTHLQLLEKN